MANQIVTPLRTPHEVFSDKNHSLILLICLVKYWLKQNVSGSIYRSKPFFGFLMWLRMTHKILSPPQSFAAVFTNTGLHDLQFLSLLHQIIIDVTFNNQNFRIFRALHHLHHQHRWHCHQNDYTYSSPSSSSSTSSLTTRSSFPIFPPFKCTFE